MYKHNFNPKSFEKTKKQNDTALKTKQNSTAHIGSCSWIQYYDSQHTMNAISSISYNFWQQTLSF